MSQPPDQSSQSPPGQNKVQGEGDYDAARRYRKDVGDFVKSANVEDLAHQAAPKSAQEERDMSRAEDQGRSRSQGDDSSDLAIMAGKKNAPKK